MGTTAPVFLLQGTGSSSLRGMRGQRFQSGVAGEPAGQSIRGGETCWAPDVLKPAGTGTAPAEGRAGSSLVAARETGHGHGEARGRREGRGASGMARVDVGACCSALGNAGKEVLPRPGVLTLPRGREARTKA